MITRRSGRKIAQNYVEKPAVKRSQTRVKKSKKGLQEVNIKQEIVSSELSNVDLRQRDDGHRNEDSNSKSNICEKRKRGRDDLLIEEDAEFPITKKAAIQSAEDEQHVGCNQEGSKATVDYLLSSTNGDTDATQHGNVNEAASEPIRKKRGRKKKATVKEEPLKKDKMFTCAVCNTEMLGKQWTLHRQKIHNNLAWKVGDKPLDLNDLSFVTNTLYHLYKLKKPFYCSLCQQTKKSVVGFMSHMTTCNKTQLEVEALKVQCNLCGSRMLPVSVGMHPKYCPKLISTKDPGDQTLDTEGTPKKRQAAYRAADLLQAIKNSGDVEPAKPIHKQSCVIVADFDFHATKPMKKCFKRELLENPSVKCRFEGCSFQSATVGDMVHHVFICSKKLHINFTCGACMKPFKTKAEADDHMLQIHGKTEVADVSDDEFCGTDGNKKSIIKEMAAGKYQMILLPFLEKYNSVNRNRKLLYLPVYNWMLEFCAENYNTPRLFPTFPAPRQAWTQINHADVLSYLPLNKTSMETHRIETNTFNDPQKRSYVDWKRYKLFESELYSNGNSMVYCGGPIHAMAWAPVPMDSEDYDQIIAVGVSLDPDKEYVLMKRYEDRGLLQFWNYGPLNINSVPDSKPTLEFCIAHDHGMVYWLEWCPSGCFSDIIVASRLGLLAVACSDSYVYVYSVALPEYVSGKIFKPKPAFKLDVNLVDQLNLAEQKYHATRVSWCKANGHKYIAAGYSNGVVGVFDVSKQSVLTDAGKDTNDIPVILPFRTITAHCHAVTALTLHHLDGGKRWMMTSSYDRFTKFWDLENLKQPISSHKRSQITDGTWPCHWLGGVTCQDDASITVINSTSFGQVRDVGVNPSVLLYANSRINSVSVGEWSNIFVHGTSMGEVHVSYPNQLYQNIDLDKNLRLKKFYVGYTALIEKGLTIQERLSLEQKKQEALRNLLPKKVIKEIDKFTPLDLNPHYNKPEPITYKQADSKYGFVFVDLKLNSGMDVTKEHLTSLAFKSDKLRLSVPHMYPIQSVNKVAMNPNKQAFLYLATGYQAGFLRVSCLRFLGDSLRNNCSVLE